MVVTGGEPSPGGRGAARTGQAADDKQGANRPGNRAPNVRRASPLGSELEPDDLAVWSLLRPPCGGQLADDLEPSTALVPRSGVSERRQRGPSVEDLHPGTGPVSTRTWKGPGPYRRAFVVISDTRSSPSSRRTGSGSNEPTNCRAALTDRGTGAKEAECHCLLGPLAVMRRGTPAAWVAASPWLVPDPCACFDGRGGCAERSRKGRILLCSWSCPGRVPTGTGPSNRSRTASTFNRAAGCPTQEIIALVCLLSNEPNVSPRATAGKVCLVAQHSFGTATDVLAPVRGGVRSRAFADRAIAGSVGCC